jgi:hypothetical protein
MPDETANAIEMLRSEIAACRNDMGVLRAILEGERRALGAHSEEILDIRQALSRLNQIIDALSFDGQGVILQEESPPVLRLLAALLNDNRTLTDQLAQVIAQNAILIGDPSAEEAAALADAQAAGPVSLPALMKKIQDLTGKQDRAWQWQRVIAVGLAATLVLLTLHHWYLVVRFGQALIGSGG